MRLMNALSGPRELLSIERPSHASDFAAVIGDRPSIEDDRRPDRWGRFGLRSPRSLRSPLRVRGTALSKETGRGCGVEKSGLGQI